MRHSPQRHTLAVLRLYIGLTQREMAELVERSVVTIQKIELGKLPLSENLGRSISLRTGVSFVWLMKADPQAPMVALDDTAPYSRAVYDLARGLESKDKQIHDLLAEAGSQWKSLQPNTLTLATSLVLLARASLAAQKSGRSTLFGYRVLNAIAEACKEFEGFQNFSDKWLSLIRQQTSQPALHTTIQELLQDYAAEGTVLCRESSKRYARAAGDSKMLALLSQMEVLDSHLRSR